MMHFMLLWNRLINIINSFFSDALIDAAGADLKLKAFFLRNL